MVINTHLHRARFCGLCHIKPPLQRPNTAAHPSVSPIRFNGLLLDHALPFSQPVTVASHASLGARHLAGTTLSQPGLTAAAFTESSYTDSVILRDRNADEPWTSASDGALEERRFYCQNWRADVVAVTLSDGAPWEFVRYSAYGEPTVYSVADVNRDGIVNYDDMTAFGMGSTTGDFAATADGEGDLDFDGDIGSSGDIALFMDSYDANTGQSGKGRVSSAETGKRKGYAGYEWDQVIAMSHVRHRVHWAEIGRWTRRDPLGYVDGMSSYEYVASLATSATDPSGLALMPRNRIGWCTAEDPDVIRMLASLAAATCPVPPVRVVKCANKDQQAYYDGCSIYICQGSQADTGLISRCKAYAHELQHALDACNGFRQGDACLDVACRELRASNISGQCCPGSPYRRNNESYSACVLRYATASTTTTPGRSNAGCGSEDVRKAMRDTQCYLLSASPCAASPEVLPPRRVRPIAPGPRTAPGTGGGGGKGVV